MFDVKWNKKYFATTILSSKEKVNIEKDKNATFVWGYLMDPYFIKKLLGKEKPFTPAVLKGFRREWKYSGKNKTPVLIKDKNEIVQGVVLLNLSKEDVQKLDEFEKIPEVMVKKRIWIYIGDLKREVYIYFKR